MKTTVTCLIGLALLYFSSSVRAAGVEADPNKDYFLSPKDGPWMIYVASFKGDEAHDMARKLAHELRGDYRLPAYLYSISDKQRAEEKQRLAELHRKYGPDAKLKKIRIVDECAVLIGHYKEMDAARAALDKIKKQRPPKSVPTSFAFITRPKSKADGGKVKVDEAPVNPLAKGFVVRNPLLKKEAEAEDKFDPFLERLNDGEPYNLLRCPQPWTLAVQVYQPSTKFQSAKKPTSVFDTSRLFGDTVGKELEAAAEQANQLAVLLRKQNYGHQPYVLHTRNSSIVTVGGFRGPNDPQLLKMQEFLAQTKQINGVALMPKPAPMEVPRR